MTRFGEESVTIVIPTKNRFNQLVDTLENLTFHYPKVSIIVVNDGQPFPHGLKLNSFKNLTVMCNESLPGESGAVNTGWKACATDLFTVVSDDDPQGPDWLPNLIESANNFDQIGVFYPSTVIKEKNVKDRELIATPYNRHQFHSTLKCPCLAGVLINRSFVKSKISILRVPGQTFPNDLIQWLNLSLVCEFMAVPNSKAFWWVHPDQYSRKTSVEQLSESYILNVGEWYLQARNKFPIANGPVIVYFRALQLSISKGFSIKTIKMITSEFLNIIRPLQIPFYDQVLDLIETLLRLLRVKFKNV